MQYIASVRIQTHDTIFTANKMFQCYLIQKSIHTLPELSIDLPNIFHPVTAES